MRMDHRVGIGYSVGSHWLSQLGITLQDLEFYYPFTTLSIKEFDFNGLMKRCQDGSVRLFEL